MRDLLNRPLRDLRLSVTDRCNLRCQYCMPELHYSWLEACDLLAANELARLVDVFVAAGVHHIHLTGGEPLLRPDIETVVRMIAAKPGVDDLALTTNGILLPLKAESLKVAGLRRITISLDTLRRDRFARLTRFDQLESVLAGIAAAQRYFGRIKLDTVVLRHVNDDELIALLEFARSVNAEIRFIEYMDVGGASRWSSDAVVSRNEMLGTLAAHYGTVTRLLEPESSAPAQRYVLPNGTTFGIVASTTEPFCATCDRGRLTADGMLYSCLYAIDGLDLRAPLRRGASNEELGRLVAAAWRTRDDRGAEDRLALGDRRAFVPIQNLLRPDPHVEMHTRGG